MDTSPRPPDAKTADAVVLGAGLSGLVAARELARAGCEVIVLEARSRPGGRTQTAEIAGVTVDLGGEWVDETHTEMRRLCEEVGAELVPSGRRKADGRWYVGGEQHDAPPLDDRDARVYERFEEALAATAAGESLERPWDSAPEEDESVADWLAREGMGERGRHVVETLVSSCGSTVPLARMSFHAYALKTASRGGPGKGNEYRVAGGAGRVARLLAAELGERVRYSSPATDVLQSEAGVEVRFQGPGGPGAVRARRAVLALPLTCYGGIRFDPEPPSEVRRMAARAVYGVVRKAFFVFDREIDRSAFTVTDTALGYLCAARAPEGLGAVVSFAGGRPLLPELGIPAEERRHRAAALLAEIYDLPEPEAVREKIWPAEPWTRGSYMILAPGDLRAFGPAMGGSFGNVHLAGAEGLAVAPSFMNSAVESGLAAGRRVASSLRKVGA